MTKLYRICCFGMLFIAVVSLAVTLYVGVTGKNPNSSGFGRTAVIASLVCMGVMTVVCVCFSKVREKSVYRLGFYILHCGVIVLIVGFVITNLTCRKYTLYLESNGSAYRTFNFEDGASFSLDRYMGLGDVKTEYYDDGNPRHYEAKLIFYDRAPAPGEIAEEKVLTVNHPVRVEGYKMYLMNVEENDAGAVLLVKYNPGEYVIIFGIVALLLGIFGMCFSDFGRGKPPKKRKGGEER